MSKVVSSLGEVVDFGKLKIQNDIEEAKNNPVVQTKQGRTSTLDPNKLGMGITPPVIKEGLVSLATNVNETTDTTPRKIKRL